MYRLRFLDPEERDFARLDKSISVRILRKLTWLAENAALVAEEVCGANSLVLLNCGKATFELFTSFFTTKKPLLSIRSVTAAKFIRIDDRKRANRIHLTGSDAWTAADADPAVF